MEKVLWNSIDKKHNGLKYSKNDKSSTLPRLRTVCKESIPLTDHITVFEERRDQVPFSMAIKNMELMHECSSEVPNTDAWEQ